MVDLGKEAPLTLGKKKLQKEEKLAGQPTPPTSPSLAPPLGMYVLYLYCIVFVFVHQETWCTIVGLCFQKLIYQKKLTFVLQLELPDYCTQLHTKINGFWNVRYFGSFLA